MVTVGVNECVNAVRILPSRVYASLVSMFPGYSGRAGAVTKEERISP